MKFILAFHSKVIEFTYSPRSSDPYGLDFSDELERKFARDASLKVTSQTSLIYYKTFKKSFFKCVAAIVFLLRCIN